MTNFHTGKLTLSDGQRLDVQMEIVSDALRIVSEGRSLGAWPLRYCRVRGSGDKYQISIDGELAEFIPDDPTAFARTAANDFLSSALSDRIVAVKSLPPAEPPPQPALVPDPQSKVYVRKSYTPAQRIRRAGVGIGSAAVGMLVLSLLLRAVGDGSGIGPLNTTSTEPTTTTQPLEPAFSISAAEFARRWNQNAIENGVPVQVPVREGDEPINLDMNQWVNVSFTVVAGKMDSVVVTVIPTGNLETDRLSRAVWTVTMMTVSPELSRQERVAVLEEMGLNISTLDLTRVSGQTRRGDAQYSMAYHEAFGVVTFQARPAE